MTQHDRNVQAKEDIMEYLGAIVHSVSSGKLSPKECTFKLQILIECRVSQNPCMYHSVNPIT